MLAFAVCAIEVVMGPRTSWREVLQEHGWTSRVAILISFGGGLATLGNPLAGWLSDRRGRRPVTLFFTLGVVLAIASFYLLAGRFAPSLWIPMIFGLMGTQVTLAAYGAEMFSTGVRSPRLGSRTLQERRRRLGLARCRAYGAAGSNGMAITRSARWARFRRCA